MKTSVMKKSLLDYAIKGFLSTKFRKDNPTLNAISEIESYNASILKDKRAKEKELKDLESSLKNEKDKEAKQNLKSQMTALKKEITKLKIITPLESPNTFTPPFEIPESWVWVRLGDIGEVFTGTTPPTNKIENFGTFIPFLGPGDIDEAGNVNYTNKGLSEIGLQKARKIQANSILVTCIGGLIGKSCVVDRECTCNQQINIVMPYSCANFKILYFIIISQYFQTLMQESSTGTATPIINKTLFENLPIPLPPLQEQKQIVQILDQLMELANEFERTQENLKRIEKRIEKSLLKFAIQGNLSKCYRKDNPTLNALSEIESYNASILKDKRAKEKELKDLESSLKNEKDKEAKQNLKSQMTALKKEITKLKIITPLICHSKQSEESIQSQHTNPPTPTKSIENANFQNTFTPPFEIPESWVWVRLGEVCEITMGQSPDGDNVYSSQTLEFSPCHIEHSEISQNINKDSSLVLQTQNDKYIEFHQGKIAFGEKFINQSVFATINPQKIAFPNSILLCVRAPVGIINFTNRKIAIGRGLCALKSDFSNNEFLYYLLKSMQSYFEKQATGSTFKAINVEIIKNTFIPLPPLQEQKYISQTLDNLFTIAKGLRVE